MPVALNLVAKVRDSLALYEIDVARECGVDAFITRREGGVSRGPYDSLNLGSHVGDDPSAVTQNRERVARVVCLRPEELVISSQVHGAHVIDVDTWCGEELVGDALVTTRDDLALCVVVADCLPILFCERSGARVGLAHAGWRGLIAGVIPAILQNFSARSEVDVVIGPHVSWSSYQVGPEVAQHFEHIPAAVLTDAGDRRRLDLAAIAISQLLEGRINPERIFVSSIPTDGGLVFFSDRAARPCGRFGFVARKFYDSSAKKGTR